MCRAACHPPPHACMAGLVVKTKAVVALVYFFCLARPRHGIASNLPIPSPAASLCGSTAPFCGDRSSTGILKCCDVVPQAAPADFLAAAGNSGASSCEDLTCQFCSASSTSTSASRLICAASLHHDDDNEAKGMSTTAKIVLIALLVGAVLVVLGLTCFLNLKVIMTTVTNTILSNRSDQNINVKVDSGARAEATSEAMALAVSDASATAVSGASAQATLQQQWVLVKGKWQLLHGHWIVKFLDGQWRPAFLELPPSLPAPPLIEEVTE